jgi:hypothetical protein
MEAAMSKKGGKQVEAPLLQEVKPPTKLLKQLGPEPDWVDT